MGGAIEHATANRECFFDIRATLFADCSGDSVLRISRAEYRRGRESRDDFDESLAPEQRDAKTMGNSILIQLRATESHVPFVPPAWAHQYYHAFLDAAIGMEIQG